MPLIISVKFDGNRYLSSEGSFIQYNYLCFLIPIKTKDEVGTVKLVAIFFTDRSKASLEFRVILKSFPRLEVIAIP